ncbi:site-specific integrase [Denitratisoma oestradiolicum]|uniref:Integrase n=1 Tax=Denitratisoma oestradiolicum TaxID=311182 RepID=A0A6S6YKW5_9PROT|nr:site-specific integrase [Denitratisoma oestradiolicum]TWO78699.1 hypothetical protein CBW56_18685 [Denitratisoma oestradiolicum]CAB1368374.1 Integrase [Denitratisoma oestradiolicum]
MATIVSRDGRWQAKVRRDGYPPKSKTFARRSDAEAWARAEEREMDRGEWQDRSAAESTTLFKLIERYAQDVAPTKRGAEIEILRLKTLQGDEICKYKLSALTPLVVAEWRDRRLDAGCAGSTVNRELNILSAVFNWARKELMFAIQNPVSGIRRPPTGPGRDRRLEAGEEGRLLAALEDHAGDFEREDGKKYRQGSRNHWIKPLVLLAIETAMRRGELLSLTWPNVDLKRRIAHLPLTKNGESRTVPLSSRAVTILSELKRAQEDKKKGASRVVTLREQEKSPVGDDQAEGIKVFPVTANALKLAFERAVRRAGLDNFRFHDLRHEGTSRLAEKLPNVIELAAVTGHKDLRMLKRYYHPRAEDLAMKLG